MPKSPKSSSINWVCNAKLLSNGLCRSCDLPAKWLPPERVRYARGELVSGVTISRQIGGGDILYLMSAAARFNEAINEEH